jgi:2-methylcitrate dehydratase PrpD
MSETTATLHSTRTLSSFAAGLRYEDLPDEVVKRTEEFFLDWAASALATRGASTWDAATIRPSTRSARRARSRRRPPWRDS